MKKSGNWDKKDPVDDREYELGKLIEGIQRNEKSGIIETCVETAMG